MIALDRIALVCACALTTQACATTNARDYDDATQLKNVALAQCIARGYDAPAVRDDALAAVGAYVEFGQVNDSGAYLAVTELADKWLHKPYQSKHGQPLTLMKCIDLFHSEALDVLVRRYVSGGGAE